MAIEKESGHEKYDIVFGKAVIKASVGKGEDHCDSITWHVPGGATTKNKKRAMHFAREVNKLMNAWGA